MRKMYDAAFPPASPPDVDAVAGYIGGDTPHVWTDAEWARQKARYRLPIFVRAHDGDPVADANAAVAWLRAHNVPKGSTLALDFETRVDAAYLRAFDRVITAADYRTMVYGSLSTVLKNPKPSGGYWAAQWTDVPHLYPGSAATQYASDVMLGKPWDLSLVADSTPLWDTQGDWFDMASVDDLKNALRQVLNEGTGKGQTSWADTNKAILSGVQDAHNQHNIIKGDLDAIKAAVEAPALTSTTDLSTVDDATLMAEVMRRLSA
jgi:hypothetical protein